jgi:hypothetical protein
MDKYQDLCARVENIITNKGYRLQMEQDDNGTYIFNIYDNEIPISNLQISNTTGTIIQGITRESNKNQLEDVPLFHINWVSTNPKYTGKNLASLIIIYGICNLKQKFPEINYVTLDDDSDRSRNIEKNVYTSLGFTFRDTIEMDMERPKRLKMSGPEKQLLLDDNFIEKAKNKIGIAGGKRKTRKRKRKTRKTKRNKSKSRKLKRTKRRL